MFDGFGSRPSRPVYISLEMNVGASKKDEVEAKIFHEDPSIYYDFIEKMFGLVNKLFKAELENFLMVNVT